jgi:hypothetical protein
VRYDALGSAGIPALHEVVQNAGGQSPNATIFELYGIFVPGKREHARQWNDENAGGFARIDPQFAGFDDRYERRYVEIVRNALMDDRKFVDDGHARAFDPNFFVELAQRGRGKIGVLGMHATPGQADLAGMVA